MPERVNLGERGRSGLAQWGGMVEEGYTSALHWPGAYSVYDEMRRRDPTIRSALNALVMLARTASWYVEPGSDGAGDRAAAEFVEGCLGDMSHTVEDGIEDALSCVWFGWSWAEICYKRRSRRDAGGPGSRYDDGLIGWRKWAPRRQGSFERWNFDETGGVAGMVQRPAPVYEEIEVPIGKSLHFRGQRDGGNPEGWALGESLYESWYRVKHLAIISGIGWQRTFVGLPVFEFQSQPQADDLLAVQSVGEGLIVDEKQYVSVPDSVKFRLESASNTGAAALLEQIRTERRWMLQTLMADFMELGGGSGSWALGQDKSQLFLMAVDGVLDRMASVINRYGVARLMGYNRGYFERLGVTGELPRLAHKKVEKPSMGVLGVWLSQVRDLLQWGPEDEKWLRVRAGMPSINLTTEGTEEEGEETQRGGGAEGEGEEQDQEQDQEDDRMGGGELGELGELGDLGELGELGEGPPLEGFERGEWEEELVDAVGGWLREEGEDHGWGKYTMGELEGEDLWRGMRERGMKVLLPVVVGVISGIGLLRGEAGDGGVVGGDWEEVTADALKWAREYTYELIGGIVERTRRGVVEAMRGWLEVGGEVEDLARMLGPLFGEARGRAIARTEVTRMYEGVADLVRESVGVPRAAFSPPTRTNCRCWTVERVLPNGEWVVVWQTARDDRVSTRPLETPWGVVAGDRALQGVIVSEGPWLGRRFSEVAGEVRAGLGE